MDSGGGGDDFIEGVAQGMEGGGFDGNVGGDGEDAEAGIGFDGGQELSDMIGRSDPLLNEKKRHLEEANRAERHLSLIHI